MSENAIVATVLAGIPILIAFGLLGKAIAGAKGWPNIGYYLGVLMGPIGVAVACILPDVRKARVQEPAQGR